MLFFKANQELKKIFSKLIQTMGAAVEWNEYFVITNEYCILAGKLRSLVFNFESKRVKENILELPLEEDKAKQLPEDPLLTNIFNMILYAFGKWGSMKGIKVDKEYAVIQQLFRRILKEIHIEPGFDGDRYRFYHGGKQMTFEEVIEMAYEYVSAQDVNEDNQAENELEEDSLGLWHNMCWRKGEISFEKRDIGPEEKSPVRIGHNFYSVSYVCPICKKNISMTNYPDKKELLIETEEGRVYMSRAYVCHTCHCFYTPQPDMLLQEGQVFILNFAEEHTAYEDYLENIGKTGTNIPTYRLNEYEADRNRQHEEEEEELADAVEDTEEDLEDAEEENAKSEESEGTQDSESGAEVKHARMDEKKNSKENLQHASAEHKKSSALDFSNKTADELESIVKRMERTHRKPSENTSDQPEYLMALENLVAKLKQKYDARMKVLDRMSDRQLLELKKKLDNENRLVSDDISHYLKQVLDVLNVRQEKYRKEKAAKSKAYHQHTDESENQRNVEPEKHTVFGTDRHGSHDSMRHEKAVKPSAQNSEAYENEKSLYIEKSCNAVKEKKVQGYGETLIKKKKMARSHDKITNYKVSRIRDEENRFAGKVNRAKSQRRSERIKSKEAVELEGKTQSQAALTNERKNVSRDKLDTVNKKASNVQTNFSEQESIANKMKRYEKKDRQSLHELYQDLRQQNYSQENLGPYLEKVYNRLAKMDEAEIDKICPNMMGITFDEGLAIYDTISHQMFLPEIKTNTLEMIRRRLNKLKMDENIQLVRKFKKDFGKNIQEDLGIHFYDARIYKTKNVNMSEEQTNEDTEPVEQQSAAVKYAIGSFGASMGEFEFPIFICDASRQGNGKRGFIVTPDHIFYRGTYSTRMISISDMKGISSNGGKIYAEIGEKHSEMSTKEKLPCGIKKNVVKDFAKVFNEFVQYLKEKPESRSIEYLANEKHDDKCCYRCGYRYVGGNVCPKCGSKANY